MRVGACYQPVHYNRGRMVDRPSRCRLWALALLLAPSAAAQAQPPPLTIVAPAAPGGGWDQTARAMQRALRDLDPTAVVQVENVPGAAGTIGLARFVSAERGRPEALLVTGLVMVGAIAANGSAASVADTTPIARLTGEHEVIVVPASSAFRTMRDLLEAFTRAPGAVSWGGGSAGGTDDLLVRLIAEAVGVAPAAANYVAFAGGGEALAAVLGGQVTAGVSGYAEFAQSVATGELRALAISAPAREPGIDVPTLRESGVPLDLANWRAVLAPPGISAAEQAALTARVRRLTASAGWRETLARSGWTDQYLDGPAFRQFLLSEQARVEAVLGRLDTSRGEARAGWTPTSGAMPVLALTASLMLGLSLAWQRRSQPAMLEGARIGSVCGVVAAFAFQASVLSLVGFIPTAAVVFATASRALGSRRLGRDAGIGLALAAALSLLFAAGLDVPLPMGAWAR